MFAPGAPRTCADCARAQARTDQPERCWYDVRDLGGCPYEQLQDTPELFDAVEFSMLAAERSQVKRESDGRKVDHYGIEPARFRLACDAYRVPPDRTRDALTWAGLVCAYANEAPDAVLNEELERLRQERDDDG